MRYNDENIHLLKTDHRTEDGSPEALPRVTVYGSIGAEKYGLVPIHDFPRMLIAESDWKSVIEDCHAKKVFAMYHQLASGVFTVGWNQNGFGYCWAYGLTAALMDCRALEGQEPKRLSPFGLAWLVNYRNRGNSLDEAIRGACERGIPEEAFVPQMETNPARYKTGWEQNALNYRPSEFWDGDTSRGEKSIISQALTILATGRPLYVAYNWWGHALECVGMRWDEKERNNVVVILRNSHNEKELIELAGTRAIFSEFYGVRSSSLSAAA